MIKRTGKILIKLFFNLKGAFNKYIKHRVFSWKLRFYAKRATIIHIAIVEKFMPAYVDFVNKYFDFKAHLFVFLGKNEDRFGTINSRNALFVNDPAFYDLLIKKISGHKTKKIIIHGLWDLIFINKLNHSVKALEKAYWIMWGGDFYYKNQQPNDRILAIQSIPNCVTYLRMDYEYLKIIYNVRPRLYYCLMYPSNIYHDNTTITNNGKYRFILLGNSATDTNNHKEMILKIKETTPVNWKIFCPLSYGDRNYAQEIIRFGKKILGNSFIPIVNFIEYDLYERLLNKIDVAIFNHERQQGMGNLISLLGLGKTVFLKEGTSQWQLAIDIGITVFSNKFSLERLLTADQRESNTRIVKENFSDLKLREQLEELFKY